MQAIYSWTPVTWTLKGNEKQFELAGFSSQPSKNDWKVGPREIEVSSS